MNNIQELIDKVKAGHDVKEVIDQYRNHILTQADKDGYPFMFGWILQDLKSYLDYVSIFEKP